MSGVAIRIAMVASNTAAIFLFLVLRMIDESGASQHQKLTRPTLAIHLVLRKRRNEVPENS
jgi:hypothetical protein